MSIRHLLLLLPLGTTISAHAFPTEIFEYVDGNRIVAFVEENDINEHSLWNPLKGSPPMTIETLSQSLQTYVATRKELKDAVVDEVELKKTPHHGEHWHYMVKMTTQVNDQSRYHYFMVLMNGKIIPAIWEPDTVR